MSRERCRTRSFFREPDWITASWGSEIVGERLRRLAHNALKKLEEEKREKQESGK